MIAAKAPNLIRVLGNGVVPQQAALALRALGVGDYPLASLAGPEEALASACGLES